MQEFVILPFSQHVFGWIILIPRHLRISGKRNSVGAPLLNPFPIYTCTYNVPFECVLFVIRTPQATGEICQYCVSRYHISRHLILSLIHYIKCFRPRKGRALVSVTGRREPLGFQHFRNEFHYSIGTFIPPLLFSMHKYTQDRFRTCIVIGRDARAPLRYFFYFYVI